MKAFIPNFVTLINVFCGSLAAVFVLTAQYPLAFIALTICFFADFFDGLLARALDAKSDVGLELDSLADCISFGLVPGCMLYHLLLRSMAAQEDPMRWLAYIAFVYTAAGALRLARFNVDEDQVTYFKGVPIPAAAAAVFGLMIIEWLNLPYFQELTNNTYILILITLLLSVLMNASFRVFSFKLNSFGWKGNELRYILVICAIVLFLIFWEAALFPIIMVYVILSLLQHLNILPFRDTYTNS